VLLEALVNRRLTGEPLAWITGGVDFCGLRVRVETGVYVPRPQSEQLARRACERLSAGGTAIDLCTGSGAIARLLADAHPSARVMATDADERAVACARANGVEAYAGQLFDPLPDVRADVIVGVLPYVPTPDLPLLQRDTLTFESTLAYDGGVDGLDVVRAAVAQAPRWLRPGGVLLLELGAGQEERLAPDLARAGFGEVAVLRDEDADVRGLEAELRRTERP
jgi:release factor glutamine methyltransferase